MIGNDVVDLGDSDAEAGTRHPRFDARVFAPSEQAMLAASPEAERLRWKLWAAKESAYKAARRADGRTVFSPPRFVVAAIDAATATVRWGERQFHVTVDATDPRYVHAVASSMPDPERLCAGVAVVAPGDAPSCAVRALAIGGVAATLDLPPAALVIRRQGRIPTLWHRDAGRPMTVSLSHHGRFVAFACALDHHLEAR